MMPRRPVMFSTALMAVVPLLPMARLMDGHQSRCCCHPATTLITLMTAATAAAAASGE